jgi:S1-C subfamily serine protease
MASGDGLPLSEGTKGKLSRPSSGRFVILRRSGRLKSIEMGGVLKYRHPELNTTVLSHRSAAEDRKRTQPKLRTEVKTKQPPSSGSGFLLWRKALVLTAYHVVDGASEIIVRFSSGAAYDARVVGRDASNDIAVLRLAGFAARKEGFRLNVTSHLFPGETVHVIGYPLADVLGREPSIVSGQVSSAVGMCGSAGEFRMTAPINPGDSGGPVLNHQGEVVGIAVSIIRSQLIEGIAFGVKLSTAIPLLKQIGVKLDQPPPVVHLTASQLFLSCSKDVVMVATTPRT